VEIKMLFSLPGMTGAQQDDCGTIKCANHGFSWRYQASAGLLATT
jgi:hypothetical protein